MYKRQVLVHNPSYPSNFLDPQLLNGVVVKVPTYEEDLSLIHI